MEAYSRDPAFAGQVLAQGIAAGVWTTYLLLSRRVKNTYYASHLTAHVSESESANLADAETGDREHPKSEMVLYDRRIDWLLTSAFAFVPIWVAYDSAAALMSFPAFLMIAALKPLRERVGSLMTAGAVAAGFCLLASPLLQLLPEFEYPRIEGRLLLPLFGFGLLVFTWLKSRKRRKTKVIGSGRTRLIIGGALALSMVLVGIFALIYQILPGETTVEVAAVDPNGDTVSPYRDPLYSASDPLQILDSLNPLKPQTSGPEATELEPSHREQEKTVDDSRAAQASERQGPFASIALSILEKRELANSGWDTDLADGGGGDCMIVRTNSDDLNFVLIFSDGPSSAIKFSFSLNNEEKSLRNSGNLRNLFVDIDGERIAAQSVPYSDILGEVMIPYSELNRSKIARARSIALFLGQVELARDGIRTNATSIKVIEGCLRPDRRY